jgi:Amt family ammonium transporter
MLKNLLDVCGAALGFYTIGYGLAYGGVHHGGPTIFGGSSKFFMIDINEDFFLAPLVSGDSLWLFQFAFAATAATVVAGTLAERCQMTAYLGYSVTLTAIIYPIVAHAVWYPQGFLSPANANPLFGVGAFDFSGSGVIHLTGGATALFATKILGARRGRFRDCKGNFLATQATLQHHSIALQFLGIFILWFGWYGGISQT